MNIVNIMWAGGSPYISIHNVHHQVLTHAGPDASISNWLLREGELRHGQCATREWRMPQRALKSKPVWRLLRPWLRLRMQRALQDVDADVVLLDGIGVARLVLPLLHRMPTLRASVLFHACTELNSADKLLLRGLPAQRLRLAAVSQTLACTLQSDLGRPVQALRVAFDPQVFRRELLSREQARAVLELPQDGRLLLGAVGRLVESKGFELLIEAFAAGASTRPEVQLAIVGEGPLYARLQARIEALGLVGRVHLCGYHDQLQQLYRAFDWLMVPSRAEGLGLVVQEAVIADVAVVCSDLPVFREQLQAGGYYLPVGSVAQWAQAIGRCDSANAQAMAAMQRQALAPDAAWQAFCDGSQRLLRG